MAWTARVVAVLLLVTLSISSVHGDGPDIRPSTIAEIMILKPNADLISITVLADDNEKNCRGFKVSLQKKECFPSGLEWYFTLVNVTKENNGELHLNLTVGACEINCTQKDVEFIESTGQLDYSGNELDYFGDYHHYSGDELDYFGDEPEDNGELKKIIVIPLGLDNYTKTPAKMDNFHCTPEVNDCTKDLQVKRDQPLSCTSATPESGQSSAAPSKASPTKTPQRGRLSTLNIILLAALVVPVMGMAVMAVIVTVVIRRASRTIIRLEELQEDNTSAAATAAQNPHEQV